MFGKRLDGVIGLVPRRRRSHLFGWLGKAILMRKEAENEKMCICNYFSGDARCHAFL